MVPAWRIRFLRLFGPLSGPGNLGKWNTSRSSATMTDSSHHHITNRVLLIKPRCFGFNEQTAVDNAFQVNPGANVRPQRISEDAVKEFDLVAALLKSCGVQVNEELDRDDRKLPDSIFPNNWISFHRGSEPGSKPTIVLYPMMAPLRREERQVAIVEKWQAQLDATVIDLSPFEKDEIFLEGTGSMVLDRINSIAYACISNRTNKIALLEFCEKLHYKPVVFRSSQVDSRGNCIPVYHTNVMMTLCEDFALVCLDSIRDRQEKDLVEQSLLNTGKTVINITESQMENFLGNSIQLADKNGKRYLFMSTKAHSVLQEWQKTKITESSEIVHIPIDTIETNGGGGIRCMIAEIFPPLQ